MSLEQSLERIANALERLADALAPAPRSYVLDEVEHVPTLTKPPLAWFDAGNGCAVALEDTQEAQTPREHCGRCYEFPGCDMDLSTCHAHPKAKETAQTTWEWLGITPPARRSRAKNPNTPPIFQKLPDSGKRKIAAASFENAILSEFEGSAKTANSKNAEFRKKSTRGAERRNTRAGQCGRCGRAGRRRLNHQMFCIDCEHEEWWDE